MWRSYRRDVFHLGRPFYMSASILNDVCWLILFRFIFDKVSLNCKASAVVKVP